MEDNQPRSTKTNKTDDSSKSTKPNTDGNSSTKTNTDNNSSTKTMDENSPQPKKNNKDDHNEALQAAGIVANSLSIVGNVKIQISSTSGQKEITPQYFDLYLNLDKPFLRKSFLDDILHTKIERIQSLSKEGETSILSLCGRAGVGKSEIVKRYIHRYHNFYTHFIWINAETELTIQASFRRLASKMKISLRQDDQSRSIQDILSEVYCSLCTQPCLLVFDNANAQQIQTKFSDIILNYLPAAIIPPFQPPLVLTTSRVPGLGFPREKIIIIPVFDEQECLTYILHRLHLVSNSSNCDAARKLSRFLGGLPFALELAIPQILSMTTYAYFHNHESKKIEQIENFIKKLTEEINGPQKSSFWRHKTSQNENFGDIFEAYEGLFNTIDMQSFDYMLQAIKNVRNYIDKKCQEYKNEMDKCLALPIIPSSDQLIKLHDQYKTAAMKEIEDEEKNSNSTNSQMLAYKKRLLDKRIETNFRETSVKATEKRQGMIMAAVEKVKNDFEILTNEILEKPIWNSDELNQKLLTGRVNSLAPFHQVCPDSDKQKIEILAQLEKELNDLEKKLRDELDRIRNEAINKIIEKIREDYDKFMEKLLTKELVSLVILDSLHEIIRVNSSAFFSTQIAYYGFSEKVGTDLKYQLDKNLHDSRTGFVEKNEINRKNCLEILDKLILDSLDCFKNSVENFIQNEPLESPEVHLKIIAKSILEEFWQVCTERNMSDVIIFDQYQQKLTDELKMAVSNGLERILSEQKQKHKICANIVDKGLLEYEKILNGWLDLHKNYMDSSKIENKIVRILGMIKPDVVMRVEKVNSKDGESELRRFNELVAQINQQVLKDHRLKKEEAEIEAVNLFWQGQREYSSQMSERKEETKSVEELKVIHQDLTSKAILGLEGIQKKKLLCKFQKKLKTLLNQQFDFTLEIFEIKLSVEKKYA